MFVGREREIAAVEEAFSRVSSGYGAQFTIFGEAGIGKTRLCDELTQRAATHGFAVHWGRSWETGGAPAYWPWAQITASILRAPDAPPLPDAAAPLLRRDTGPMPDEFTSGDPSQERFAFFEAVAAYLRQAADRHPMLLVIEDAHTADEPSIDLGCFLATTMRSARILLLLTARPGEARAGSISAAQARLYREGTPLTLARLSAAQVATLVTTAFDHCPREWPSEIFRLTEGNPLFVHEMIRGLLARPTDTAPAVVASSPFLQGVTAVLRERIDRLGPRARVLVDVAATVGREVPHDLLEHVAQLPSLQEPLGELLASGLLAETAPDRYTFSHLLVREALYRGLGPDRRRSLHAAVARHLGARVARGDLADSGARAHHALLALPLIAPSDAARACMDAAAYARGHLAHEEAITWLERALAETAPDELTRAELLLKLGWALAEAGRHREQMATFDRAAETARRLGDSRLLARAALGYGAYYVLGEVRAKLVELLREALALLPETDRDLRARLEARLAAALTPAAVPDEPLMLARTAIERARDTKDIRTRIDVGLGTGSALSGFAPAGERVTINEALLRAARTTGDGAIELRALCRLVTDHLEQGEVARADACLKQVEALSTRLKLPRHRWQAPLLRSMRAMIEGRFADCAAAIEQAEEIGRAVDDDNIGRCIAMHRLHVSLLADDPEGLARSEADALAGAAAMSGADAVADILVAAVASRRGDVERGRAAVRRLVRSNFLYVRASTFLASAGEAIALLDLDEGVEALHELLLPRADGNAVFGIFAFTCGPPCKASLGALAARLGRADEARERFAEALARTHAMRATAHEIWVRLLHGRALVEQLGDPRRGRDELARAAALAGSLGLDRLGKRAQSFAEDVSSAPAAPPSPSLSFALLKQGDKWRVERQGRSFHVRDLRGMTMLARLVENPGQELHVTQLAGVGASGDAGELIDGEARAAYRRRVEDLRDVVEEAEAFADSTRAARARAEIEALEAELARAIGLGGRARKAGSTTERARVTVQRRVREAIGRIAEQDIELGRHLDFAIRTGTFCIYDPAARRR